MRNTLAFLAALILVVVGVGLYLDWFRINSSTRDAGRRNVNIEVNTDKIGDDLRDGGEYLIEEGGAKLKEILDRQRQEEAAQQGGKSPTETAKNPSGKSGPSALPRFFFPEEEEPSEPRRAPRLP
jgi:hypothetical protein